LKLSIIIVNYNVQYFLEQALLSVRKAVQGIDADVYVVDNNSSDGSVAMVADKFPEVQMIANTGNPGFSIANNQAINISHGEYVLLLNPDTVVEADTFRKCITFMDAHPLAGALGVRMIDGSGTFLPESKRGFPSASVAFYKTFGFGKIFPRSATFNHYYLGHLSEHDTNEVEVLAGAFMFMRRTALEKVGLLDETFFMYGEDIDLSYRITQGGYKNYYLPETTIIHYKGESTKKGSLNYVRAFYEAMIIFTKKHFTGSSAWLLVLMLQFAIYLKAGMTLASNFIKSFALPLADAVLLFVGLYFLKDYWAVRAFNDINYYRSSFLTFNVPLYISFWLVSVYFNGGYDYNASLRAILRGLAIGTLLIAAVYGFLNSEYRTSRMLIVFGAAWAAVAMLGLRMLLHFWKYRNFAFGSQAIKNMVIVGELSESERVQRLIYLAQVQKNLIGTVAPNTTSDSNYLQDISHLEGVVQIYGINEIIFCSRDVSAQDIMAWMTRLGPNIAYKIVPEESLSIIGSASKNEPGELYTIDIQYNISTDISRRNKRVLDIVLSLTLMVLSPILIFMVAQKSYFIKSLCQILLGNMTLVGYAQPQPKALPKLKKSLFSPLHGIRHIENIDAATIQHLNFLYAKDYTITRDWSIVWRGVLRS
jgi:GT2 family glycosyltransferase